MNYDKGLKNLKTSLNILSNELIWPSCCFIMTVLTRNVFPQCPHTTLVPSGWAGIAGCAGCSSGISITGLRLMMRLLSEVKMSYHFRKKERKKTLWSSSILSTKKTHWLNFICQIAARQLGILVSILVK